MRLSWTRPPSVALRTRMRSRAFPPRTVLTGWSFFLPLSPAAGGGGACGRPRRRAGPSWAKGGTLGRWLRVWAPPPAGRPWERPPPPRRRAAGPRPSGSAPGPRQGRGVPLGVRATGRGAPAGLCFGPCRPGALAPPGGGTFSHPPAYTAGAPQGSAAGRASPRSTGGRSAVCHRGAPPPYAPGTRAQRAGPAGATRRGSGWGNPGTPWGETAERPTLYWPCVMPPCIGGTVYHKS
jgi:hypothetical protein